VILELLNNPSKRAGRHKPSVFLLCPQRKTPTLLSKWVAQPRACVGKALPVGADAPSALDSRRRPEGESVEGNAAVDLAGVLGAAPVVAWRRWVAARCKVGRELCASKVSCQSTAQVTKNVRRNNLLE
jgi:hypothetical protein